MNGSSQRIDLESLKAWEKLGYGMFIHFGMSTFDGSEVSKGNCQATVYAPNQLDVDQWIQVARDAGMKYAILTTKHVSGFCLWPTSYTDYHVGKSSNKTNVVEKFLESCDRHRIIPGFYYCSWDNHNLFGSVTPSMTNWNDAYVTEEYMEFQSNQIDELLMQFGSIGEVWIDIPKVLPRGYRHKLYERIASLQPKAIIVMNNGIGDGSNFSIANTWPTDVITIERFLPNSHYGYQKLHEIEGKCYYIPGEVCETIGREWFFVDGDSPRSDEELLGIYLISRARQTNLLLNVGPDTCGLIPQQYISALMRLRKNIDKIY